jgi:hypothetical protein
MTRSALIDMAVREAITVYGMCRHRRACPSCFHCLQNMYWYAVAYWPRLLSSHPIDTQGGSHD